MEIPNIDQALEVHLRLLSGTTRLKEIIKKKNLLLFSSLNMDDRMKTMAKFM